MGLAFLNRCISKISHSEDNDQRLRVTIPLQRFIEAAEVDSEDDSNFVQSVFSEIKDARSISSEYDSVDQEIVQQVLMPRKRQHDELHEFSESEQIESDASLSVPGRQRRRLNSDVEDEQSEEKDEKSEEHAPSSQDQTIKDVLKKLAPTPKRKQRDNQRVAIQLIEARMHQKANHYDPLNPDIDEDKIKTLHEKSNIDITPLIIKDQPVLVKSENNELQGAMLKKFNFSLENCSVSINHYLRKRKGNSIRRDFRIAGTGSKNNL
ncbi:MAG: hypothetical protein EZS28_019797 [Streblomastix strix]|uniref:Uncharacterized protein n=1 Tax=Streblomastix strix TaxID=222440 RepID=A0A5J4VQA5_9EUKA|nr:MAG: hypothetical protein EZS28_019797 [Streblomastix strix]